MNLTNTNKIFTVSRLNQEARFLLEEHFSLLWVEGEISNFVVPTSGHWYFSLKDANSQVRCAMFKPQNRMIKFNPKDGMHVLLKARVSLYEGKGEFQLVGEYIEEVGEGKLRQAFEALKKRLETAGLFSINNKKAIPSLPKSIGIITSPTGAAIRDILSVLSRRFACASIYIYPSLVQGSAAVESLVQAIEVANRRQECDVLILTRGGGSLEDLWSFNEEALAYAIYKSVIPIVTGIGHEIDFTIADFVADVRAATPSAAAELVSPSQDEMLTNLTILKTRLLRLIMTFIKNAAQEVEWLKKHIYQLHPKHQLREQQQKLDRYEAVILQLINTMINKNYYSLNNLNSRIKSVNPLLSVREIKYQLQSQFNHFQHHMNLQLKFYYHQFEKLSEKLDALSPLSTLKRGYAIVTDQRKVIRSSKEINIGEQIQVKLSEGSLVCEVKDKG